MREGSALTQAAVGDDGMADTATLTAGADPEDVPDNPPATRRIVHHHDPWASKILNSSPRARPETSRPAAPYFDLCQRP
jgi:hypothetical protein